MLRIFLLSNNALSSSRNEGKDLSSFFLSASGTKLVWFAIAILCAHSAIARYESFAGNRLGFWR